MALSQETPLLEIAVNIKDKLDEIDYNEATWEGAKMLEYSVNFSVYAFVPITTRGLKLIASFIRWINNSSEDDQPTFAQTNSRVVLYVQSERIMGAIIHYDMASAPSMTKVMHMFIAENGDHDHISSTMYRSLRERYSSVTEQNANQEPIATSSGL